MAGELPFEKPLNELRKKIEELKKFGARIGHRFHAMKFPASRNAASSCKKKLYDELTPVAEDASGASSQPSDVA